MPLGVATSLLVTDFIGEIEGLGIWVRRLGTFILALILILVLQTLSETFSEHLFSDLCDVSFDILHDLMVRD